MDNPAIAAIIARHKKAFEDAIESRPLNKKDRNGPKLDAEIRALLLDGFDKIIEGLDYANTLPGDADAYVNFTRAIPALLLEGDLQGCAAIKAYGGNKKEAVWYLLGDTIKAAVGAAAEAGIVSQKNVAYIKHKYFDTPYVPSQDPFDLI